jgi:predicted N-acyltransferase
MTEEEFIELGDFIEGLNGQPSFSALVTLFETQCVHNVLNTAPHEKQKREQAYFTFEGFRTFQGFMNAIVEERDTILKANQEPSSDDDAPYQE